MHFVVLLKQLSGLREFVKNVLIFKVNKLIKSLRKLFLAKLKAQLTT